MASDADEIENEDGGLDIKLVLNLLSYAVQSLRYHPVLFVVIFVAIFGAAASSLYLLPKTYHVETKLLVQRNPTLAVKGDTSQEPPSRGAPETVKKRDNLVSILHQTDMLHQWYMRRAPLAHLKDVLVAAIRKPETEEETMTWMADKLDKNMSVWTAGDDVVQIGVDWPDPQMALRLVVAAQQNYLESRHATEITAIAEQIAILQNHADTLRGDIDTAVDAIEKLRADRLAKAPGTATAAASAQPAATHGAAPVVASRPAHPALGADPELAQLKASIEAKQRAINDLEDFRRRRLSELNASLAEKSAMYTDNHPAIIDLRQTIASLSTESPQVQSLRAEVQRLQKEFEEKSAAAGADSRIVPVLNAGAPAGTPPPLPGSIIRIEQEPSDERDPAMMYARTQLRDAMDKYAALRAQIEAAQIELDTAQAAFKYRYSIVDPPLYPKGPTKPKAILVLLAGLLGGLVVALLAAVGIDLRRGRFVAKWQIERALNLPTLAEIDVARLAEHKID